MNLADAAALLAHTQLCVLIHDAATKDILWANPAACALLEFSLEELRPLKAPDMSSTSEQYKRSIGRAWLQDAVDRGESRIVWRYRSKSGLEYATDAVASLVQLSDGAAIMVQFRDIERELRMQESLARSEALFDAIARHSVTVVAVLDSADRIEFATDGAERMLDATPIIGRLFTDLVEIREMAKQLPEPLMPEENRGTAIRMQVLKSGRWLGGMLERLSVGGAEKRVITLHDITELHIAEIQRARLAEYENYLARHTAMGDLALTVSHELAQPLAAASNFLAASVGRAERAGLAAVEDGVSNARFQIERARKILVSLRDFFAHQEHRTHLIDLNEVVEESLYFVSLRAEEAGIELRVELSDTPLPVRCESVLTEQVMLNLCFNGIDELAASGGTLLIVRTRAGTDAQDVPVATFEVEDHGRGVPADRTASIFEAGTTGKDHGSGIGLALSRQVIVRQRGDISVLPAKPQGAIFAFSLPLALDEAEAAD